MRGDPAGAVGSEFGAEEQLQSRALRARRPLPPRDPRLSWGGRKPEAVPTVGSVLPLVLHGRRRSVRESRPVRPQPGQPGGSAGCSAPPRPQPRPARVEPRAGGGRARGRARAERGWGPNVCFTSPSSHRRHFWCVCCARSSPHPSIHLFTHPSIYPPIRQMDTDGALTVPAKRQKGVLFIHQIGKNFSLVTSNEVSRCCGSECFRAKK